MVPLAGLEPALAAYLALTGYKSAALPIELQGRDHCDRTDIRLQPLGRWLIICYYASTLSRCALLRLRELRVGVVIARLD